MQQKIKKTFWIPIIILILEIIIVIISPEEKSIAAGIKPVYVHVSLTWTAMFLFLTTSVIALISFLKNTEKFENLLNNVFGVSLTFHLLGLLMSVVSSYINWGGVRITEARYQLSINVLILSGIAFLLMKVIKAKRFNNLLGLVPTLIFLWTAKSSEMGLHPDDPVMNSPASIKYTFLALFFLMMLLASWLIVFNQFRNKK